MRRSLILMALALTGVITSGVLLLAPIPGNWMGQGPVAQTPQITVLTAVDEANETVHLTHAGGDTVSEGIEVRVLICPVGRDRPVNATLLHNETTVSNGLWVSTYRPAAAPYPLELNDSVRVLGDGVDSDRDGTAGIENGETLVVKIVNTGTDHTAERTVLNETVGNGSERPCRLN